MNLIQKLSLILLLFFSLKLFSQEDISGLWVAYKERNDYYGLIFIKQNNKGKIEGITYDEQAGGYCNFQLEGKYNKKRQTLYAKNTNLIEKTPDHIGGIYDLKYSKIDNKEFLVGTWTDPTPIPPQIMGGYGGIILGGDIFNTTENVIKVIYERPREKKIEDVARIEYIKPYIDRANTANAENKPNTVPTIPEKRKEEVFEPQKPAATPPPIATPEQPKPPVITIPPAVEDPILLEKKAAEIFKETKNKREDVLLESISTQSKKITLYIRDYGKQDGDRISIYLNDETIRYNMLISNVNEKISINLPLDKKTHKLYFVANNLGEIPPNTAQLTIVVDGKKNQKTLFTDEKQNKYIEIKTN